MPMVSAPRTLESALLTGPGPRLPRQQPSLTLTSVSPIKLAVLNHWSALINGKIKSKVERTHWKKTESQRSKKKKKLVEALNLGLHPFYKGHFLKKEKKGGGIKLHLRRERRQGDSPLTN